MDHTSMLGTGITSQFLKFFSCPPFFHTCESSTTIFPPPGTRRALQNGKWDNGGIFSFVLGQLVIGSTYCYATLRSFEYKAFANTAAAATMSEAIAPGNVASNRDYFSEQQSQSGFKLLYLPRLVLPQWSSSNSKQAGRSTRTLQTTEPSANSFIHNYSYAASCRSNRERGRTR